MRSITLSRLSPRGYSYELRGTGRKIYIVWNVVSERWNINSDRKSQYARARSCHIRRFMPRYLGDKHSRRARRSLKYDGDGVTYFPASGETMIIISVIILIRLGFIASASRGRTGIYYYQTILSRARARFTCSCTMYDISLSLCACVYPASYL